MIFLGLNFGQKGFFVVLFMKDTVKDFYGLQKNTGIFLGIIPQISSNQQ